MCCCCSCCCCCCCKCVRLFRLFGCYRICDHGWSTDFLFHFRRLTDNNLHAHKRTEQTDCHVNTYPHTLTHTYTQVHTLKHPHIHTDNVATKICAFVLHFIKFCFILAKPFENCWQIHSNCLLLYACVSLCLSVWVCFEILVGFLLCVCVC